MYAHNKLLDFSPGELLVTKADKVFSNLSLQARTRLSELAVEKQGEFEFNNEKLQKFLKSALEHLSKATNKNDAEHIAHFLMGIKTDLPKNLPATDLKLNGEQKQHLHNALRTNRFGIFGKEKNEKTIEKLSALQEEVNFEIEWSKKISPQKTEEKTDNLANDHPADLSAKPGHVSNDQQNKKLNKNTGVQGSDACVAENQKERPTLDGLLSNLYNSASETYKEDTEKWEALKNRVSEYFKIMARENSKNFTEILANSEYTFDQLVESFTMYTALPTETANKMATERELVNIRMKGKSASENERVLGHKKSLAQRDPTVIQPGQQLSLATKTKIRCKDGRLREITLLSGSSPALDVASQPEADIYTYKSSSGGRKLNRQRFAVTLDTLKSHILQCAGQETNCPRVVLAGIGTVNFLKLLDEQHKRYAEDMIVRMLAEVVTELRAQKKTVVFTDINDEFCKKINAELGGQTSPISFVGDIPGNWIEDDDLMLNAWDPNSLLGNGLAADNSLDGFYGRSSLIHFQHALLCMMTSLGIPVRIEHVPTQPPASRPVTSSS